LDHCIKEGQTQPYSPRGLFAEVVTLVTFCLCSGVRYPWRALVLPFA
jgi:hypothetical protein